MKQYTLIAFAALLFFAFTKVLEAKTVTEGTIDLQNLAIQISTDLKDYSYKRDGLVENIKSVQKDIQKLREDFRKTESEKDRITIQAQTLRKTSQLLNFYHRFSCS